MKLFCGISLLIAALLVTGCGKKQSSPSDQKNTNSPTEQSGTNAAAAPKTEEKETSSGNPITAPVDYLGAVANAQQASIKKIDLAYVEHAIQQFNAQEGRNPKDLDELIKERYLTKLPAAPYGMRIQYDAASGKVRVIKK